MQNTGTWDSDVAIFYFFCLISPICLYFFAGFIQKLISMMPDVQETEISFTQTVGEEEAWQAVKDQCLQDAINGDYRARDWLTKNVYNIPAEPTKPPAVDPAARKSESTNKAVIDQAILGLKGLGYKSSDARRIVNKFAVERAYKNPEVLLRDVLSGL